MTNLETAFTEQLLSNLSAAEKMTGIPEKRLAEKAVSLGGPKAVKAYLQRRQSTRQFEALQRLGRLDLTPEYLVTLGRYAALFTDKEADQCLALLLEAGAFTKS